MHTTDSSTISRPEIAVRQTFLQRFGPALLATAILWGAVAAMLYLSLGQNDGRFIYAYDDAYIHLAIARNFGLHGVWGVTQYGFTSSASSLLWPLLLAATAASATLFELMPLLLNLISATAIVWLLHRIVSHYGLPQWFSLLVIGLTMVTAPIYSMVLTGMEHLLHAALMLALMYAAVTTLTSDTGTDNDSASAGSSRVTLPLLAFLLVLTRYEAMFPIITIAALLWIRKRRMDAAVLVASGLLPIVGYGIISAGNGWYFLPNSVLLKGQSPDFSSLDGLVAWVKTVLYMVFDAKDVLLLIAGSALLLAAQYRRHRTLWRPTELYLLIFLATAVMHKVSAGSNFRYTAYLMITGSLAVGMSLYDYLRTSSAPADRRRMMYATITICALVFSFSSLKRGLLWTMWMPQATTNIYEQQFQMGRFVGRYYDGQVVAANDIGLVSYGNSVRTLDLVGLANMDVARLMRARDYSPQERDRLSRAAGAKVALVYDSWFTEYGGIPAEWQKVGEWTIIENRICGGPTVSIYAIDPAEREALIEHLREFSPQMPKDVVQAGVYMEGLPGR